MAKTADLGHDDNSAKDVGRQLRHVRRKQGLSRSEVARSAGLTRRELAAYERGKQSVPESDLWCLAGSCGVDVGDLLPERAPVQVNSDLSLLAVGESIRYLRSPVEDDELLRQYLAMIYELRNVPPGSVVPLRERDLVALADALGGSPERIEARLVELIGMSREEAARLRAMILPPRSLGAGVDAATTTPPIGAPIDAPTGTPARDVFGALATPESGPVGDHDQAVADFFAAPRAPDPFDAPPPPEAAPHEWAPPEGAPESAAAFEGDPSTTSPPIIDHAIADDPFAAPPASVSAPELSPIAAPPPASPPIAAPPPVADVPTTWPPEGFVVEAPSPTEPPLSMDLPTEPPTEPPTPEPPTPEPAVAWDAATALDVAVTDPTPPDSRVPGSVVPDAWAIDAPADLAAAPAPSDEFLAAPADADIVPIPPAFDAFAPPATPAPIEALLEAAPEPAPATTPETGIDAPSEAPVADDPADPADSMMPLPIVDPFGDDDAGRTATPSPNGETSAAIAWAPESSVASPAASAPEFERANSHWRVGGIFPATATADDGALALRRADARWALANLRATADFTIEANVDFAAGAGFGVLFRASVDATDRVTGYSFDVDPIAGGGGYLVRQWIDNRQHWRPIATAPVTDPAILYGRHTISLTMRADQLTVLVDGDPVLTIPALSRSSIEVGREPCRGDCIGIQAWATTEVTIDSFRVARY